MRRRAPISKRPLRWKAANWPTTCVPCCRARPITQLSAEFFPGAVVLPIMSAGATDGSYLRNAGIPTYGHSGMAGDVGESRIHGRDERVLVKSFFNGNEYLYRLVKEFAGGK